MALQGGVSNLDQQIQVLSQDQEFAKAPIGLQSEYLLNSFLPQVEPGFQKAPIAMRQKYVNEVVLPKIQSLQVQNRPSATTGLQQLGYDLRYNNPITRGAYNLGRDTLGAALSTGAGALRGASLGYLDLTPQARQFGQSINADYSAPVAEIGGDLSGNALGIGGINKAVGKLAAPLAANAAKYGTELGRQAYPVVGNLANAYNKASQFFKSPNLLNRVTGNAVENALYGAAYNAENPQQRLQNAAVFGGLGAGLGAAGRGIELAAPAVKGAIQKAQPSKFEDPIGLGDLLQKGTGRLMQSLQKDISSINLDYLNPKDKELLSKTLADLQQGLDSGRALKGINNIQRKIKTLSKRSEFNQGIGKNYAPIKEQASLPAEKPALKPEAPVIQTEQVVTGKIINEKPPIATLRGNVTEMINQALDGKTLEEAKAITLASKTLGSFEKDERVIKLKAEKKALGRKKETQEARAAIDEQLQAIKDQRTYIRNAASEIHPNLRAVLETNYDGSSAVADQLPVDPEKQFKLEQIPQEAIDKLSASAQKELGKIAEAMKAGVSIKAEVTSEVTGSTDAAAKITPKGNVKVPVSEFTPTHFKLSADLTTFDNDPRVIKLKAEKEALGRGKDTQEARAAIDEQLQAIKKENEILNVVGYNTAGHTRTYPIDSPSGSNIKKVSIQKSENFVGTYPNVYLGPRKYKVADILKREPDVNEGVLTSTALSRGDAFKNIFASDSIKSFSKETKAVLKDIQKRGQFSQDDLNLLVEQVNKDKKDLQAFCSSIGLI